MSRNISARLKKFVPEDKEVRNIIVSGLAEFIGTGMLVYLGCMGCVKSLSVIPTHLQITLNFGLAVLLILQCIAHISHAHINPAITVGAVILGKKTIKEAIVYIVAQILGAIAGFGLLKVVTPRHVLNGNPNETDLDYNLCVTDLHANVSAIQGLILEGVATAILMFVACAVWDKRNEKNTDSVPIKFGLTVAGLATAVGPYTGCSMNPARSLAPALWNNYWSYQWIYWLGPIGGSFFITLFYKTIFGQRDEFQEVSVQEDASPQEVVALNSVDAQKVVE